MKYYIKVIDEIVTQVKDKFETDKDLTKKQLLKLLKFIDNKHKARIMKDLKQDMIVLEEEHKSYIKDLEKEEQYLSNVLKQYA